MRAEGSAKSLKEPSFSIYPEPNWEKNEIGNYTKFTNNLL